MNARLACLTGDMPLRPFRACGGPDEDARKQHTHSTAVASSSTVVMTGLPASHARRPAGTTSEMRSTMWGRLTLICLSLQGLWQCSVLVCCHIANCRQKRQTGCKVYMVSRLPVVTIRSSSGERMNLRASAVDTPRVGVSHPLHIENVTTSVARWIWQDSYSIYSKGIIVPFHLGVQVVH